MTYRIAYAALPLLALVTAAGTAATFEGRAWGDIHVQTMDGATYEFQATGEYVASRSTAGDLEVQLRLESRGFSPNVSIATSVAVLVDTTRASVALGREPMLFVDGQPAALPDGALELPRGGRIESSKRGYEIYWSDGSILSIDVRKRHLNAFLRPAEARRSTLFGLFGNFNGKAVDDVEATVASLGSVSGSEVSSALAGLARTLLANDDDPMLLAQEESIFEYEPGQNTYSFRRPKPTREATPEALSASWRKRAEKACEEAGVTEPDLLKACIVDVGYTRDESFADTAAAVQERDASNWDSEMAGRVDQGF
ncbi:MAG: VWD domain-containing protein [Thermoanaerobaculia bacterium]